MSSISSMLSTSSNKMFQWFKSKGGQRFLYTNNGYGTMGNFAFFKDNVLMMQYHIHTDERIDEQRNSYPLKYELNQLFGINRAICVLESSKAARKDEYTCRIQYHCNLKNIPSVDQMISAIGILKDFPYICSEVL